MKVVIDTNLWISALISKSLHERLGQIVSNPNITIFTSSTLFDEVKDVVQRPKIQKYTNPKQTNQLLDFIKNRTITIMPTSSIEACRDPNDNFLIALCIDSDTDFLLSGDKDLLVLHPFQNIQILSLGDFERLLELR